MSIPSSGVSGEGFSTIVHPATSAGASFDMAVNCGTFHGAIAPTTPTGSRRTITFPPNTPARMSSHSYAEPTASIALRINSGGGDWPTLENEIGEPISVVMTSAISSRREAYRPANRCRTSMRSDGVIRGQGPLSNASRAAATARSMSASDPSGTRPTSSSLCGEITSITLDVAGSTHSPPM